MLVPFVFWISRLLFRFLLFLYTEVEVEGLDKLPRRGGVIVAGNHLHNADPGIIGAHLRRRVVFMAKAEMFEWPVWGFYVRLIGAFPVRRFEADLAALRRAAREVSRGAVLVMFPEGTRSQTGELQEGHPGTALVALRSGASILPVGITGTEALRVPQIFFKPIFGRVKIRMVVGNPFFLPPVERINAESVHRCTGIIMGQIAALLPPGYRGVYRDKMESAEDARSLPAAASAEPTGTG